MNINGREIAESIREDLVRELIKRDQPPSLGVVVATDALATRKFVERKRQFGESIGISVKVYKLSPTASTDKLLGAVEKAAKEHGGVVVQLPLPVHAGADAVRNAIPISHDIDVISDEAMRRFEKGESKVLPPVAGAIEEIAQRHGISFSEKHVVVLGTGRLVGRPAAVWAKQQGATVKALDAKSRDTSYEIKRADIIILGAGSPGFLKPEMVKEGVVIFDAGTSEAAGKLRGDADPACAEKASFFTPVPGGIGPITVAVIFKNLHTLACTD